MWEQLIAVLSEMVALYQALVRLAEEKRAVLVAGNAPALEAITRQEELLIIQAGKLESLRASLIGRIAAAHGLSPEDLTLAKVGELADGQASERIVALGGELRAALERLAPLNQLNTQLIEQALKYIQYNINVLTQAAAGPTYTPPQGAGQPAARRTILDTKV
ncbi:flagellar protein FlgN [Sporolituus thermophilus]|uniref:FlgN protein n=1 Tax=Sporolituus thermophilus DSM 23256 TaxID=1123285 RepID=A0A1G7P271_9FIRM|nr:flagellar protein FlgN [Sporolituus thermophilus]SDF79530.1 FlgN protein [Sporolituus thermophilus DSM 23256]